MLTDAFAESRLIVQLQCELDLSRVVSLIYLTVPGKMRIWDKNERRVAEAAARGAQFYN